MGSVPAISVVIACRDDSHLAATLRSLAAQRAAPPYDVIVVNTSADDLAARLEDWRDDLDLAVVDASPHLTAGAARNIGVAHARGDLLLFVDADDTVDDGYVRAMAEALRSHPMVCASVDVVTLNRWNPHGTHPQQTGPITGEMGFLPFAGAGTLGIGRSLFDDVGGFDAALPCYEEADLCWRIQLGGGDPPAFVREATLHYRLEPNRGRRWRKAVVFGRTQARLFARYRRAGMPRARIGEVAGGWWSLVEQVALRAMGRPSGNVGWPTGIRVGRIMGSIGSRVVYL